MNNSLLVSFTLPTSMNELVEREAPVPEPLLLSPEKERKLTHFVELSFEDECSYFSTVDESFDDDD